MRIAWNRFRKPKLGKLDFDPDFYRAYYADLHIFDSPRALLNHYIRHGKDEGRFASLAAARRHYDKLNGPPPADFDARIYQQLNPDLAKLFHSPVQYELHFLETGRFESRPYKAATSRPEDFWHTLLNIYDFNLLNETWLPPGGVDRDAAIALMERDGIARLAPISRDWIFDPAFYRAYNKIDNDDDAALYRDWLHKGFPAGRTFSETRAISGLMGGKPYPECFDWKRFGAARGLDLSLAVHARIAALEGLFASPLDELSRGCVSGAGAGRLYEAMGSYNLVRAHHREAAAAFALALERNPHSARLHLRHGEAQRALDAAAAMASFQQALALPDCSILALHHLVKLMLSEGLFSEAMGLLQVHKPRFRAHELFDRLVVEVASTTYRDVSETMLGRLGDDAPYDEIDAYADVKLSELTQFLQATKIGDVSLRLTPTRPHRVAILACLEIPQCTFYRVEQKRRLLEAQGFEVEVFDFNDPSAFLSALPGAASAIFYRVPGFPRIIEAILYARSLGIETFFDIDDLVFTRDFPSSFESYENQITHRQHLGLRQGVPLYRHAIQLCDAAIVSTPPLAEAIAPLVSGGADRTFVVPNGLDDRSDRAMRFARGKVTSNAQVSIFYGTGTKAHNSDFSELVAPALLEVLEARPNVRLVLVGHLHLGDRFDAYASRISRIAFIADIDTYWSVLAACDINISVLHPGRVADGKSEIKWLEAALLAIPSIVPATKTFEAVVRDGETGLIARDADDWRRHLRLLIEDEARRKAMGAAAHRFAMSAYGAPAIAKKLEAALFSHLAAPAPSSAPKKRILLCNVFFAPQSYGGATRVFEDNIGNLLDRYGDEFEVTILSTYVGLRPGALRVDSYRGCPVYRIGSPIEENGDWRPFNDDMLPAFQRVLGVVQPHLVHFHCMQRLTASLVEETLRAGIPYVVTVHDAWWISDHQFLVDQDDQVVDVNDPFGTLLPAGVERPDSLLRTQRLKSLLNYSAATLAVSRSFADIYRRAGATNVATCENGVSPLSPPQAKATPPGKIVLGQIGGRTAHKGATLIEVVLRTHAFRNLELLMVDNTLDVGEQETAIWGTTPVTFQARVGHEQVDALYAKIDVLLAPSIWPESYGLVAREAMHYRTWVVVSDRGALGQDVVEGENGFVVDPSRTDGLAAVLKKIDDDVEGFKAPPKETKLRSSAQQLDDIVAVYRRALGAVPSVPAERR